MPNVTEGGPERKVWEKVLGTGNQRRKSGPRWGECGGSECRLFCKDVSVKYFQRWDVTSRGTRKIVKENREIMLLVVFVPSEEENLGESIWRN